MSGGQLTLLLGFMTSITVPSEWDYATGIDLEISIEGIQP